MTTNIPAGYGPAYPQPFNARCNELAVITFILSLFFGPVAIPFGHIARRQIRRSAEQGNTLALAGLVIGYAYVGIFGLAVAFVLVGALFSAAG